MPIIQTYWTWEEAFDKFGFNDGDGLVMTYEVADFIGELGYEVEANGWGMHNTIITKLFDNHICLIINWVCQTCIVNMFINTIHPGFE